jgi:hypothetical protein
MYSIVSSSEAGQSPYPYVFVNEDGTARELYESERKYLEEPFSPFDGGRPYVKSDFDARDGWGSIKGFCHRSHIPCHLQVASAPAEDPNPPMSKAELIEELKKSATLGWEVEVIERADGTIEMKRTARK